MRKTTKNCSKRKAEKTEKTLADIDGEAEDGNKGFNACYLLTSLSPRHKGHSYIGFTVNPKRRIRQHNGEINCGATRTKKKRPWEMILCIYGFPTQVAALQFEWAWQHPIESLAVRKAACNLKSLNGLASKIKVAFTMLTLHTWQSMDLTVNFFSTKYMTHVADCPSLPRQMKVQFGSMDDLPCYYSGNQSLPNDENDWDLDPHECSGNDDDIEDCLSGSSNPVGENRHCFHATASSPENQEDKESQKSQDNNVLEQRDPFLLGEDDDFQKHFNEDSGCNQVHPFDGRSPLPKGDSFFLIEDDDDMEDRLRRGLNPAAENRHYFDATASAPEIQEEKESQQSQENNVLEQRDSFFLGEDNDFQKHFNEDSRCNQVQPFEEGSPLPKGDSFFLIEDDDLQKQFYEDSGFNLVQPFEGRSLLPKGATVETQSSTVRQIEVIDLFTPSPDCKKRKVDSADTKIIDLTRSPDFVQL